MIDIKEKEECCGCGGCAAICPKKCITMQSDNEGFLYPNVDISLCINCSLCEKVCPVIHQKTDTLCEQTGYLVQNKDENIRSESTAGGAFTAIAQYVIENGGVVFGVTYTKDFKVVHTSVTTVQELWKFRNSKYVQSDTGTTFTQAEKYLKEGKMVCYSGTPCQIEGLKHYLRKDYDNLITVDIVCHAVPSPLVWNKYLEMQTERFGNNLSNILFRDKHYGYKYSTMTLKDNNGKKVYTYGIDTDPMLRAFFSNICDRPICYKCCFKKRYRMSDFTIWDCFTVADFEKSLDDDKGTTRVLVHNPKAQEIFNKISDKFRFVEISPNDLTKNVKEMFESIDNNSKRENFFKDANSMSGSDLFKKYFPETLKVKMERSARIICYKTGIYSTAKRIVKKIIKK